MIGFPLILFFSNRSDLEHFGKIGYHRHRNNPPFIKPTLPILAIFFVAKEPVTFSQLQEIYPSATTQDLKEALQHLISNFNSSQKAMEIREVGGGYRMTSLPEHHEIIHSYLKTKPSSKLSLAALETLSVIAYKQPVTVPEIMEIRGVRGTSTIRTLLEKRLIK